MASLLLTVTNLAYGNTHFHDTDGVLSDIMKDEWKTGFVSVDDNEDDIFYWMFKARQNPELAPLVLWLSGGPGCSSEVALLYENGPMRFNHAEGELEENPYSWNNYTNLLYVDQPIGTGYSHGGDNDDHNEQQVAQHMAHFLRGFLQDNPEFVGRDFYITGESYAGYFVPSISAYLKTEATDVLLNLKGVAIGNGLVDPHIQYPLYPEYSFERNLISAAEEKMLSGSFHACKKLIEDARSHHHTMTTAKRFEKIV